MTVFVGNAPENEDLFVDLEESATLISIRHADGDEGVLISLAEVDDVIKAMRKLKKRALEIQSHPDYDV